MDQVTVTKIFNSFLYLMEMYMPVTFCISNESDCIYISGNYEQVFGLPCERLYQNKYDWYKVFGQDARTSVRDLIESRNQDPLHANGLETFYQFSDEAGAPIYIRELSFARQLADGDVLVSCAAMQVELENYDHMQTRRIRHQSKLQPLLLQLCDLAEQEMPALKKEKGETYLLQLPSRRVVLQKDEAKCLQLILGNADAPEKTAEKISLLDKINLPTIASLKDNVLNLSEALNWQLS
ncbi:MAG: hypothetical protein DHS20C10_08710 [marine bacterium B5-7]|nr:MAG: hypothetical protein DHS20C10_08710 [marine bacterium B5-7]